MTTVSLKNLDQKEQYQTVNTPKSIEACFREGIRPEELLYAPLEEFARPNLPKEIQKMNYEFYESQRLKLLKLAKARYAALKTPKKTLQRSRTTSELNKIINNDVKKMKEKQLNRISKLVNYKLDCLKINIDTESLPSVTLDSRGANNIKQSTEDYNEKSDLYDSKGKTSKSSELKPKKMMFCSSDKILNYQRDAELIAKEKKEFERNLYYEKQKNLYIESVRKRKEEQIQEHLQKAKMLKEAQTQEKLEKIMKKNEMADQQIRKIYSSRDERRKQKLSQSQGRFLKVVSTKVQFDEYIKEIRNQIVREENEKIASHEKNKKKVQEEIKERIINKNKQWDAKSKKTRDEIDKRVEERKEQKNKEIKDKEQKMLRKKNEEAKKYDFSKEKNKLKEIETNWNIERVNRKEEFAKNEILNRIELSNKKVLSLQSAREFMQRYRYDINLQSESQKLQIDNAIYMMGVQKKINIGKLKEIILSERLSPDLSKQNFNSTR